MPISPDAASSGGFTVATNWTVSHTCTGSNLILWVGTASNVAPSGVTYNGVSMTEAARMEFAGYFAVLWYLIAPDTGAHNIVAAFTNRSGSLLAASYAGALQSGVPDAHNEGGAVFPSTMTRTVTTVADNCWAVLFGTGGDAAPTASTGSTERASVGSAQPRGAIFDSNGPKTPAGSLSMVMGCTGTDINLGVMASFAPATGGGGLSIPVAMTSYRRRRILV